MRVAVDANTVISGLLFPGKERRLLEAARKNRCRLVLAEDVVDEVYMALRSKFRSHAGQPRAPRLFSLLRQHSEFVPRSDYARSVVDWTRRVRDARDAPVLACGSVSAADVLVSGDRDILSLRGKVPLEIRRTRDILSLVS